MDYHQLPAPVSSCGSGSLTEPPHMDLEPQAGAGVLEESCSGAMELAGRTPPRVDSCPDMDTRPPLTPELMPGIDMGAQDGGTFHMQELLSELPHCDCPSAGEAAPGSSSASSCQTESHHGDRSECQPCLLHIAMGKGLAHTQRRLISDSATVGSGSRGLLMADTETEDMATLFQCEEGSAGEGSTPLARLETVPRGEQPTDAAETVRWGEEEGDESPSSEISREDSLCSLAEASESRPPPESDLAVRGQLPGPCEPEDLLDGVVFGAKYLGSTQLQCERHQMPSTRMRQAQEAVDRVKAPDGESQPMTEVDVMISTQCVKVLTADTQEALMDHPLQTISYTADIGSIVVIMARRKSPRSVDQTSSQKRQHRMLCHVFQSADAQLIAQAIGQAFAMAYRNFLLSEGVPPERLESTHVMEHLYNADLAHFSKKDNCREVYIQKQRGEVLGVAVVESGWGSLLPTVVIANLMHRGPAERSGELSIGDHVTSVNGTSLVGLPFSTCQGLIRELKGQSRVILSIVRCPPVVTAIIQRPDTTYQLGFCVEDGVISSLVRGGIAERGGIRVGHRIIEINGQSVVATAHEKIIQTLLDATGEVYIKTMPASTYRLLTGQETPIYL
ncbi:amyloid-beta A4 precursor protein-binding family A member 3 isoform X2 [Pseudophryne corroboree]|uniref:amyloid-beta A4 precursor protein-binding family A member 3 isoform X2 n=1 Tax=Pseudophryne corroboree TaxID=495146 RepID=UPI003081709E